MSEPIPESIPTSADPRSRRPVKRIRTTGKEKASDSQADEIDYLMWDPSRPVTLPPLSSQTRQQLAAPPEIVANVQGSSAGAGSGEFHVYKASRRREYERLKNMDEEAKKEEDDKEWESVEKNKKEKDDERTRKKREKRNRRKNKTNDNNHNDKSNQNGGEGRGGAAGLSDDDDTGGDEGDKGGKTNTNQLERNGKKGLQIPKRKEREGSNSDFAVAEVIKENGITIHDDD